MRTIGPRQGAGAGAACIGVVGLLAVLGGGCHGRDDLDGRRRPVPGLPAPGQPYEISPSALAGARPVFDFYDNRAAAVVHDDGAVVIECGTSDMAKYVEGAYRSHWHLHAADQGKRAALVSGLGGELYLPIDDDPGGVRRADDGSVWIELHARAAAAQQLVSVFLDERRIGDISMPGTEWQRYRIQAPAATVKAGERKLRFYFRHTGEIDGERTAAAIGRIRVGAPGQVETPALTAGSVVRGGGRLDALQVPRPARLSFYLAMPAQEPALVLAHARPPGPGASGEGASGPETSELAVYVATGSGGATRVWQGRAGAEWTDARVDLRAYAGQVVRIDLTSEGPADWGRPRLVASAPAPPDTTAGTISDAAPGSASGDTPAPRTGPASASPGARSKAPAADHVIVWVVSALRADRVLGSAVPRPGFARLAGRGLAFSHALTPSPVPGAAHAALMTGRAPRGSDLPADLPTLAERMTEAGYTTALISGNGFVNDEQGFARGFSVYENPMRRRHPFDARVLWQRARRLLQRHRDGRTFLYVVTVEPHLPYRPSPESLAAEWSRGPVRFEPADTITLAGGGGERLGAEEQAYVRALYDGEVRDADAAFGAMLADLETLGLADRAAVVLVGDHGEELWERGGLGHGRSLYQEVLHVPLVVAPPPGSIAGGRAVSRGVTLLDVFPTVLALAGLDDDPRAQGRSLLDTAPEQPALPRPLFAHLPGQGRSLVLGRYKLVVPLRGPRSLYDLRADPAEQRDRLGELPLVTRYLRNVFGIGVAYERVWRRGRWGDPANVRPAFSADQGL